MTGGTQAELEAGLARRAEPVSAGSPLQGEAPARQKTAQHEEPSEPVITHDAAGVWHIRGFKEARAILRSGATRQAGFKAEIIASLPRVMNAPILYQEGKEHQQQRKQTARFFAPKVVSEHYRQLMEEQSAQLIARLEQRGRADLSHLALEMAVSVAAQVVGLTDSRLPGMERRLETFFAHPLMAISAHPRALFNVLATQWAVWRFYRLDVLPAIHARRREPRSDVISHLLARGYSEREILTECITYASAGMITTREFMTVAAWHLLEQPLLRERFLSASETEQEEMLEEILRLEPVVGHLYRRTTADLPIMTSTGEVLIPRGALLDLHVYGINADERIVGEQPQLLSPGRVLKEERVAPSLMGFGDGAHRCPGAPIALQESAIFLRRLLALPGLRLEQAPRLRWNEVIAGYEIRDLRIILDPQA